MRSPVTHEYPFFFTWSRQDKVRPLELIGGDGAWFDTADGGRWLDMGALVYQANVGHGHERMIEAVKRQADSLCLATPTAVYPAKVELAQMLLDLAPPGFSKVFFTLGGSEANENALKIARMVTGRYKAISRFRSYHGATMGALTLSGDYRRPPLEPGIPGVVHALDCYCDRCPFGKTLDTCQRECAQHIGQLMQLDGPESFAAVFMEPVPGANGVLVPPPEYWPAVREACDRHGTLLVCDEVLTGFGRTGKWFGHNHFPDAVPDMIVCGKGLTGGYGVLGAVLVHERVASHFDHNFLYAGLTNYAHPLGCAAGVEAIKVYREENLIGRAEALSPLFLAELEAIKARHPEKVSFTRGQGLLAALELNASPQQWESIVDGLVRRRVYTHPKPGTGMLVLSPPLCISEQDMRHGLGLIEEVIAEY